MTMADDTHDIFGKIDAMLGKRAGFGGVPRIEDEFPLLTEVVDESDAVEERPPADPVATLAAMIPPSHGLAGQLDEVDIDRLAAALEARLSELFIRQQLRIEALVRRVVREELDKRARD
jgi:hypothetical protein